jgi:signal transduction histidine kinase/CheY-like chemotaxis protein/AraC-like DNA-binding protein
MGWFAIWIKGDSTITNQKLSIRINHDGASEIYIDGKPVGGLGKVGTTKNSMLPVSKPKELIPFWLQDTLPHLMTVKYSNFSGVYPDFLGFQLNIGNYELMWEKTETSKQRYSYLPMSAAAQFILALLHLLLFVFYPKQTLNLYYALLVMAMAVVTTSIYLYYNSASPLLQYNADFVSTEGKVMLLWLCCLLLYKIGYDELPKGRMIILTVAVTGYLILYFVKFVFMPLLQVTDYFSYTFLLFMFDALRSTFNSTQKNRTERWLIGAGVASVMLLYVFAWSDMLKIWPSSLDSLRVLTVGLSFLILPLCLSLYLAMQFAKTNQILSLKLQEVQALSEYTLKQEEVKRLLIEGEAKRLEEMVETRTIEISTQAQKLRELDAVKSRFFTNITHEFRTPLTLIINPARELLAKVEDLSVHYYAGLIQKNAQQLLGLINQLLDLSKIENGLMEADKAPLDVMALLRTCTDSFQFLAKQKNIRIEMSPAETELWIESDRDKLTKIFTNVLSNAVKFTQSGTVVIAITVNNRLVPPQFTVTVQDSGKGISADKLPYIFERFYQADYSDTRNSEGSGIGLALTKELTELLGGNISVASIINEYTNVTISLPFKECSPSLDFLSVETEYKQVPITANQLMPNADINEETPQLVIIEDNEELRNFIAGELSAKFKIQSAIDGISGVKMAQDTIPDLIITDIMMPGMDGYQVCTQIKSDERTSHIPVIMLTAKTGVINRVEGINTGADAYLEKPFIQDELEALVENLIKQRMLLKQKYLLPVTGEGNKNILPAIEQNFIDRINAAVEHHLDDASFGADQLASEIGMSRAQLHRKLKAIIGRSPGELIRANRLAHAHYLLKSGVANVSEAAYQVGFTSPTSFSTSFSRYFGYPPSDLIK